MIKQSERLPELLTKYSVAETRLNKKKGASKSKDSLAKFGAVCCDCGQDLDEKCKELGLDGEGKLPSLRVLNAKTKQEMGYKEIANEKMNMDGFVEFALEKLDFLNIEDKGEL